MKNPILVIALCVVATGARAAGQSTIEFPPAKVDLPVLSLADSARERLPSPFGAQVTSVIRRAPPPRNNLLSRMPIIAPPSEMDFKLLVKTPDPTVDYKMIIKVPEVGAQK